MGITPLSRAIYLSGLAKWLRYREFLFRVLLLFILGVFSVKDADARFASRFSLSVQEEYNDNLFFSRNKDPDFVTSINPTLTLLYQPTWQNPPVFTADVTLPAQIFARHSEQNNFAETQSISTGYTYRYSPKLTFDFSDSLRQLGRSRTTGSQIEDLVTGGDQLTNDFSINGEFLYTPKVTFTGNFSSNLRAFLNEGGNEISNSINARGTYTWGQHSLYAGYGITVLNSRTGEDNVIHNLDIGDDYFSNKIIRLTPTLTLSASSGISFNAGKDGPRIANNTNVSLTKIWQSASLTAGLRKGLTSSLGVSGPSETTSIFENFNIRLTPFLTLTEDINFSFFDTDDDNFNMFEARTGLQYFITTWLSSNLSYTYRARDIGEIKSNSVMLSLTVFFDIWPNARLGRGLQPSPPTSSGTP